MLGLDLGFGMNGCEDWKEMYSWLGFALPSLGISDLFFTLFEYA